MRAPKARAKNLGYFTGGTAYDVIIFKFQGGAFAPLPPPADAHVACRFSPFCAKMKSVSVWLEIMPLSVSLENILVTPMHVLKKLFVLSYWSSTAAVHESLIICACTSAVWVEFSVQKSKAQRGLIKDMLRVRLALVKIQRTIVNHATSAVDKTFIHWPSLTRYRYVVYRFLLFYRSRLIVCVFFTSIWMCHGSVCENM